MLLGIIPTNVFAAAADNDVLAIMFFALMERGQGDGRNDKWSRWHEPGAGQSSSPAARRTGRQWCPRLSKRAWVVGPSDPAA